MSKGAYVTGQAFFFNTPTGMVIAAGFGKDVDVMSGDENTTLVCVGGGSVKAVFGDGQNIALGGNGNDTFFGGEGVNQFFGGRGNDTLFGGLGANILDGGTGSDTLVFGEGDTATGGPGADHFVPVSKWGHSGYTFVDDLSFKEGDHLDLSYFDGITRANMVVRGDELVCYTPGGILNIEGVGNEITLVGGIDAAAKAGYLSISDMMYGGKG